MIFLLSMFCLLIYDLVDLPFLDVVKDVVSCSVKYLYNNVSMEASEKWDNLLSAYHILSNKRFMRISIMLFSLL